MKGKFLDALVGKDLAGYRFEIWCIVSAEKGEEDVSLACKSAIEGEVLSADLRGRGYEVTIHMFPILTNGEDIYIAQTLEKVELDGTSLVSKGDRVDFFIPLCFAIEEREEEKMRTVIGKDGGRGMMILG